MLIACCLFPISRTEVPQEHKYFSNHDVSQTPCTAPSLSRPLGLAVEGRRIIERVRDESGKVSSGQVSRVRQKKKKKVMSAMESKETLERI